jgi:hypothetical protein
MPQALPQRATANAKSLAKRALRQPAAGLKHATRDCIAKDIDDLLPEGLRYRHLELNNSHGVLHFSCPTNA